MLLTTNRLTTFDDAFQSRIHFAVKLCDLAARAKKTTWETFVRKVPTEAKIADECICVRFWLVTIRNAYSILNDCILVYIIILTRATNVYINK